MSQIIIPANLRPADGRFGPGPSKVRTDAVHRLASVAPELLGTSHRRAGVKDQVRRLRQGLRVFFALPGDYEVVLGNGGATLFWNVAAYSLIRERSAHAVFGEFSAKFAKEVQAVPFLRDPIVIESEPGTHPDLGAGEAVVGVDAYALTQCETSTGVAMTLERPAGDGIVLVDATSAAGGMPFDAGQVDAYYFSPQKCFASEGGLWVALLSPRALERAAEIAASARPIPAMLDLDLAIRNSRQDQTYNTPSISTVFLMAEQVDWMNAQGGLAWAAKDCAAKAQHLYDWAEQRDYAQPFVAEPALRSTVVVTIDLDASVPADEVTGALRANGIVDTEAYRKLGRNQLRVAVFPAIDAGDVELLTASVDFVVERLR